MVGVLLEGIFWSYFAREIESDKDIFEMDFYRNLEIEHDDNNLRPFFCKINKYRHHSLFYKIELKYNILF